MLRPRIIPCLLLKGDGLVKTVRFGRPTYVGDPINVVRLFNDLEVDELVILDIDATRSGRAPRFDLLRAMSNECFMPLAYGGGVRSVADARQIFKLGMEKVVLNSAAVRRPALITELAKTFGNQSILVSIDVKSDWLGRPRVFSRGGQTSTGMDPLAWAKEAERLGAGEIVLNSIDRDGTMKGYDIPLIEAVCHAVRTPVIACGGAGTLNHLGEALRTGATGAAAGSLFVFKGPHRAVLVNYPSQAQLDQISLELDPHAAMQPQKVSERPDAAASAPVKALPAADWSDGRPVVMGFHRGPYRICTRCVMDTSDPHITFDANGVCNHCHTYDELVRGRVPSGKVARDQLSSIIDTIRTEGAGKPYDCIIGVSGGVDSTYVALMTKKLGLRPLAVHLDNGWDSGIAVKNIANALDKLGIDLYTHVIEWEEFKDIQRSFLLASTPDAEIPTDHAIFALLYQQAKRLGIRYVVTGLNVRTETHLPSAWSQGYWDWGYIRAIHRRFGRKRIKTFPHFNFYNYVTNNRHQFVSVNVLDYVDYSKERALVVLRDEMGWEDYGGKHFENVYTRWFQGCYLPRKFGFDKRRSHLSSRICSGELTRDEALAQLQPPPYPVERQDADCEYVAKKLGFDAQEFAAIMQASPAKFEDFSSYDKWSRGRLFAATLSMWQFFKYRLLKSRPATA